MNRCASASDIAEEADDDKAGSGVGADHGSGVADHDIFVALFPDKLLHIGGLLRNIAMADHYDIVIVLLLPGAFVLFHVIHKIGEGFFCVRGASWSPEAFLHRRR